MARLSADLRTINQVHTARCVNFGTIGVPATTLTSSAVAELKKRSGRGPQRQKEKQMRSTWSGHLGFGLVQIPIKLFKSTENHDVAMHTYCPGCGGSMGMIRACKSCGGTPEFGDILRGTEVDGKVVIVSKDEADSLEEAMGKQIEILQFVEATEIDPIMYGGSYYVGAPEGAKPYALLMQAMADMGLVALARFAMRQKTSLAALRVKDGVLVLHTLVWPDEVRAPEVPGLGGDFSAAEMKMAKRVVESMVRKFEPDEYTDLYQERLRELIAAKAEGAPFEIEAAQDLDTTGVEDLMAQLEASIQRHPAGKRAPAKKAPAKKAPAKRTRRSVA